MSYYKSAIYTAIIFLAFVIIFALIMQNFSPQLGLKLNNIQASPSSSYLFSYLVLLCLYILIPFPLSAKYAGKNFTKKKWLKYNLIFGVISVSILTIFWLLQTDWESASYILVIVSLFSLLMIFLAGYLWLYIHTNTNNSSSIKRYINKNFSEFSIEQEFTSLGRNKIFLIHKESESYVLKITRKSMRRARREVVVMRDLQPHIPMPKLISYDTRSTPGHILMTYCGPRLAGSDKEKHYFNFGELIAHICKVPLTDSVCKVIKKNVPKKIRHFIKNIDSQHPYPQYLSLYNDLPATYFAHGDLTLDQVMLEGERIIIIDWESASLSYRLCDLARALSHSLEIKLHIQFAQAILAGYTSIAHISDEQEVKFLLGLIWSDLYRSNAISIKYKRDQKRVEFIKPLLADRSLEEIFKLNSGN